MVTEDQSRKGHIAAVVKDWEIWSNGKKVRVYFPLFAGRAFDENAVQLVLVLLLRFLFLGHSHCRHRLHEPRGVANKDIGIDSYQPIVPREPSFFKTEFEGEIGTRLAFDIFCLAHFQVSCGSVTVTITGRRWAPVKDPGIFGK